MFIAKRTFTAGKDSNGQRIIFEQGKKYKEIPEGVESYFVGGEDKPQKKRQSKAGK